MIAMAWGSEKIGCSWKPIFRTSGTSAPYVCVPPVLTFPEIFIILPEIALKQSFCPFCLCLWHNLFHIPQTGPAESALLPSVSCAPYSCSHQLLLCSSLSLEFLLPFRPMATSEGQAFMIEQLDGCNSSIPFVTKPPTFHWLGSSRDRFSLLYTISLVPQGLLKLLSLAFSMLNQSP